MSAEASLAVLETRESFYCAINKQWISGSPVKCTLGNLLNEYWAAEDTDSAAISRSSVQLSAALKHSSAQVVDITQPWLDVFIQTM